MISSRRALGRTQDTGDGQIREHASKETRQKFHCAFQPVLKSHAKREVSDDLNLCDIPFHSFTPGFARASIPFGHDVAGFLLD